MHRWSDIEDFTTDELRQEIYRRERATMEGKCWYCKMNLEAHTCKYAKSTPVPGWEIQPPRWVSTDGGCMGHLEEYWQTDGRHPIMGDCVIGVGDTKEEATLKCIEHAHQRQQKWQITPGEDDVNRKD